MPNLKEGKIYRVKDSCVGKEYHSILWEEDTIFLVVKETRRAIRNSRNTRNFTYKLSYTIEDQGHSIPERVRNLQRKNTDGPYWYSPEHLDMWAELVSENATVCLKILELE